MEGIQITWSDGTVMSLDQAVLAGKRTEVEQFLKQQSKKIRVQIPSKEGHTIAFNPCAHQQKVENKMISLKFTHELIHYFKSNGFGETNVKAICDRAGTPFGTPECTHIYKGLLKRMVKEHLVTIYSHKGVLYNIKNKNLQSIEGHVPGVPKAPEPKKSPLVELQEKHLIPEDIGKILNKLDFANDEQKKLALFILTYPIPAPTRGTRLEVEPGLYLSIQDDRPRTM